MVLTAIIGAGLMGRWHAEAIAAAGSQLALVVDSDRERAVALARRHGASAAARVEGLERVHVVHVCTTTPTHSHLIETALRAGCHVLVEKPLADTAAETDRLLSIAQAAGRLLCPVHQFVFQPGVRSAIERLPRLAPVQHIEARICSAGGGALEGASRNRLAWDILPHPLSVAARLLPDGAVVTWAGFNPLPGEIALMGLAGPTTVAIRVSMTGRPPQNALRIVGAGGTVTADLFHGFSVLEPPGVSRGRKLARPFLVQSRTLASAGANLAWRLMRREWAYPGLRELVGQFHQAVRDGGPPPISSSETRWVARQIDELRSLVPISDAAPR
jgi:predicted dehydrogenase